MPISFFILLKNNSLINRSSLKKFKAGFSLFEVIITLVLISLIFLIFSSNMVTSTPRDDLDHFFGKLEGAIYFSIDEAVLKNKIIRIHFLLEKKPQEYKVEVANDDNFIRSNTSKVKKNQFSTIAEFEDGNQKLPENISIIGIGDSTNHAMIYNGEASIYFYPNGSRDRSILILNTSDEIATFDIPTFLKRFNVKYQGIEHSNSESDLDEILLNNAKEIFTLWLKK